MHCTLYTNDSLSNSAPDVKSGTSKSRRDLSIAWSGLTQNTLDLGILDTDLAPEIAISWSVLDCYPPFLLGWHGIILQTV